MTAASSLDPRVLDATYLGTRLGSDLERLDRVAAVDAHEATILYGGRILELVCAEEVQRSRGLPSSNVFGNLVQLSELGVLPELPATLFHALRRLANEARHVTRVVEGDDAQIAYALVIYVIGWHFTRSPVGPQLPTIWTGAPRFDALERLVSAFELEPTTQALQHAWAENPVLERSVHAAAVYAEMLLAIDDVNGAARVVCAALEREPRNLRLRQLDAWITRMQDGPARALDKLEELLAEREDVETLGLLAGTHKRMGNVRRSSELYYRAWKHSDSRSGYAGINAASMALLAGDRDRATRIAKQLELAYERRRRDGAIAFTGFWDLATYAETKLLVGDLAQAARAYREAFSAHAAQTGLIASTRQQLELLLSVLVPDAAGVDAFVAG